MLTLTPGPIVEETVQLFRYAPFAAAGFFCYNGLSFEQFIWAVIKSELLFAGERKYISENPYYEAYYGKGRDSHD